MRRALLLTASLLALGALAPSAAADHACQPWVPCCHVIDCGYLLDYACDVHAHEVSGAYACSVQGVGAQGTWDLCPDHPAIECSDEHVVRCTASSAMGPRCSTSD